MHMEPFGLLNLLRSALSLGEEPTPAPTDPPEEIPQNDNEPKPEHDRPNAFLELIQRHDAISKHIQSKK